MEIFDIYDENRQKTGRTQERGTPMQQGDYHIVVHVWIVNDSGEYLIQRRQPWKRIWPDMWDCSAAGCAIAGDDSKLAAIRETEEELGVHLNLKDKDMLFTVKFSNGFDDIWVVKENLDIAKLKLQYEEVADAKWANEDSIKDMVIRGEFIDYFYLDELFKLVRNLN